MEKIKKFFHIVIEKYGFAKLMGSILLAALFYWLFERTGNQTWKWIAAPFAFYAAFVAILLLVFAWIINPLRGLIKKIKSKKS